MSFEKDKEYDVVIDDASLIESSKGTRGLEFRLVHPEHGTIFHCMWLTDKSKKRAGETLIELGVGMDDLRSADFWRAPVDKLHGVAARITTEEDEYEGRRRVRVKWFNGTSRTKKALPAAAGAVATLFEDFVPDVPF